MYLSASEQQGLARVFGLLAEDQAEQEVRRRVGAALLDVLRADHFASFVWDAPSGRFVDGIWLHMDDANLARYERWYQYHDPITFRLQACRRATLVSEVMPHAELRRTEFFNDFLARDGLHWGINLHGFDGPQAVGDLRIWRGRRREEFGAHERDLLDLVAPAFVAAMRRLRRAPPPATGPAPMPALPPGLSRREAEVAACVCRGLTDKQIARELDVSVSSVRTYLRRLFDKVGVQRRAGLSALAAAAAPAAPRPPGRC